MSEIDEIVERVRAVVAQQTERLQADLGRLEVRLDRIDGRLDRLESRIHRLESRVDVLDARLSAAEAKITERLDDIAFKLSWVVKSLLSPEERQQMLRGDPPPELPGRRRRSADCSGGTGRGDAPPQSMAAKGKD